MCVRLLMVLMLLFAMILPSAACAKTKTFQPILLQPEQSIYAIKSIIIGNNTQTLVGNKIQDEQGQALPDDYYRLIEQRGDKFEATPKIMRIKGGLITENSGNIIAVQILEEKKEVVEKEGKQLPESVKSKPIVDTPKKSADKLKTEVVKPKIQASKKSASTLKGAGKLKSSLEAKPSSKVIRKKIILRQKRL
jgi:hypothetical protein